MPRSFIIPLAVSLVLLLMVSACSDSEEAEVPIEVELVPVEAITTIFPAAVDSFQMLGDTTYRGYMSATPRGAMGLSTTARIYEAPDGTQLAINLSSFDNRAVFMAAYGGDLQPDTTADLETYNIFLGRLVMADNFHAAEIKSFDSLAVRRAIELIDFNRFAALERVPIQVDSTFLRR